MVHVFIWFWLSAVSQLLCAKCSYSFIKRFRISCQFGIASSFDGIALGFSFDLDASLPVSHPGGGLGDQLLILDRRRQGQFDSITGNLDLPSGRVSGFTLWALPSVQGIDLEFFEGKVVASSIGKDNRSAGIRVRFPILMPNLVEH